MKSRLIAIFAATLFVAACGKKDAKVDGNKVAPAEGKAAAVSGEKAAEAAARGGKIAEGKVMSGGVEYPTTGPADAKVHIIEISDFQCPFCSRVNPTIAQIKKEFGDSVQLTFMHNALSFHKDARGAAIATAAAHRQGKFWEMHDKLFANQKKLKAPDLERYAGEIGLDVEKYKKDIADPVLGKFVDNNQRISVALGATGTPAFFINGKNLRGAQPFAQFKTVIEAEIAAADKAGKKGAAWIKSRTATNNKALAEYYFDGKTPPKAPKKKKRPVDRTVYKVTVDEANDAIKGGKEPLVTLVEFSEFQCPFCKKVLPTQKKIMDTYGDKVRIVFKHNPLPFHKQAGPASKGALCAKDQGKFWEMHGKLFENQRKLDDASIKSYAEGLKLDMAKWNECFASKKYDAQIDRDQELAGKVTARGTPNTFVNGRKLTGAKPFAEFKTVIDEEIKKAEALLKKGVAKDKLYAEIIKNGKTFEPLEAKVNKFTIANSSKKGNANAKIQIVEFSDFQCPFCSRVTKPLNDVQKHYGDDAVVVFKHFPLSFHKEAKPAAIASLCADKEGKFWELHDVLFANMKALKPDNLKEYAKKVGLDAAKFDACMADPAMKKQVESDMAEGRAAGVRGTPTIFINGRKFNSPSGYNVKAFTSVIDKYLLKK